MSLFRFLLSDRTKREILVYKSVDNINDLCKEIIEELQRKGLQVNVILFLQCLNLLIWYKAYLFILERIHFSWFVSEISRNDSPPIFSLTTK